MFKRLVVIHAALPPPLSRVISSRSLSSQQQSNSNFNSSKTKVYSWASDAQAIGAGYSSSLMPQEVSFSEKKQKSKKATVVDVIEVLPLNLSFKRVAAGCSHSLALTSDGSLYGWGSNYFGQLAFFPHLSGGLFESDDDIVEAPVRIEEGFGDKFGEKEEEGGDGFVKIDQIATGDFHNLALTKAGTLFTWGAGTLGTGSELFCSEPKRIMKEVEFKLISCAENTSLVVDKEDNLFIFGTINHTGSSLGSGLQEQQKKANVPIPLQIETSKKLESIKSTAISSSLVALLMNGSSRNSRVVVGGTFKTSSIVYPYNPIVFEKANLLTEGISIPLLLDEEFKPINSVGIIENFLVILYKEGNVELLSLENPQERKPVLRLAGITNMQINRNSAIFSTQKEVLSLGGKVASQSEKSFWSLMIPSFSREPVQKVVPGISLASKLQDSSTIFDVHPFKEDVTQVSSGFDHFLVITK